MDTGGNKITSPANTSLTGHGNNNEQDHINQHVANNRTSKTQTQRDNTEIDNDDIIIPKTNGPTDTGSNIQPPTDKKQKTTNDNDDEQQEATNLISQNDEQEGDWSTVKKKPSNNRQQDKHERTQVAKYTLEKGIKSFTMADIVAAIDKDKYEVPEYQTSVQISLTEGKETIYNDANSYIKTVRKFFQLLQQHDPTVMILAWNSSLHNDPITNSEELTIERFEKFYSINRRISENNKRIDMTILIASAIQMHTVLKSGRPYRELQKRQWYIHLTKRRYVGEQMTIGWLLDIHPVFTNVFTLKDEIVDTLQGISEHISLGQKTEKWRYNDERGWQQSTHVRVLCVQAPKELGPQIQKELFEQWKNYRETHAQDNKSTMSGGMFIPYDVELHEMRMLLAKQERFLKQYQYSVILYKCRTLTKEFLVPETVANILALEPGSKTTLEKLLLSMTVTDTSKKLVRSIERIDGGNRFQLIVHKDNIEMCRLHMQNTLELLRNNVEKWHEITETDEGASLAPNGYTHALMISPEKLQKKKTFLTNLAQGKTIIQAPKSKYHQTWQAGEAWGSRGVRGGRGGKGRERGISNKERTQGNNSSKLILSTNQTDNEGGGYEVAIAKETAHVERQFALHKAAREKEKNIEQQLMKSGAEYINDIIEKDNAQEDMDFALETIQTHKGMEAMFQKYVAEAVEQSTKVQTLAIAELQATVAKQSDHNTTTMVKIQEKLDSNAKEQFDYNDAAHNVFRFQIERLETEYIRKDEALTREFQAMCKHIEENDKRRDTTNMDMFNMMLQKMNEGNFTPMNDNNETEENTIPFTDPTTTPKKQYTTPTNETSQTPIELDDSSASAVEDNEPPIQEHNETTVTKEDITAMEAIMNQSKEDTDTQIRILPKTAMQADIQAKKNNATTKLTTLKSKYSQSKNNSTKYQAPTTRSKRSNSGRDLGKNK